MKIYVGHSSTINFREELYSPLRELEKNIDHEFVLPHQDSDQLFDSRSFLKNECDLMLAEVSKPSTGLGIELGWASGFGVPIVCIHREGAKPSGSLSAVTDRIESYADEKDLRETIKENLGDFS